MPKVDLKVYSNDTSDGKKITSSIAYVNPNASNSVLQSFAQQLNDFTTNEYDSADRIETINVDTDTSRKQFRNITVTGAVQGATATMTVNISNGETVNPAVFFYGNSTVQILTTTRTTTTSAEATFTFQIPNTSGIIFVGLVASNNFYADFVDVNVT